MNTRTNFGRKFLRFARISIVKWAHLSLQYFQGRPSVTPYPFPIFVQMHTFREWDLDYTLFWKGFLQPITVFRSKDTAFETFKKFSFLKAVGFYLIE